MSGVELVAAALAAGATSGLTDTAHSAVRDTYAGLVAAVRRRLRSAEQDDAVVDDHVADPVNWHGELVAALTVADAGRDVDLVAEAERLLAQIDPASIRAGKYVIDLREAKGVQVGDNPTMTLNF